MMPRPAKGRCAMSVSKKFCRAEYDNLIAWLGANCGEAVLSRRRREARGVRFLTEWVSLRICTVMWYYASQKAGWKQVKFRALKLV